MKLLAALILCLSLVAEAAPSSGKVPRGRATAISTSTARRSPVQKLPAGSWVVDIHELVPSLRPMPQKEMEDQLRDWALYGLLMRLGLGADELARTTHQLAPVRLPYLEELFAFEYGRGRRAILSDERVLLLYEQDDPDPQATLGRLADRVRMEMGRVPGSFELYTFTADVTGGELRLEFQEAVSGRELFSKKYGYHEAVVTSSQELAAWLNAVDDVAYVAQEVPEGLRLGGRRFGKSRTRSVSLEDVAALYQAHSSLAARRQQQLQKAEGFRPRLLRELESAMPEEIREASRMFPFNEGAQRQEVDRRLKARAEVFWRSVFREMGPVPPEPGFSLDPLLDERGLVQSLSVLADEPCRALQELRDKARASIERLEHTKAWPGAVFSATFVFGRDIQELRERCQEMRDRHSRRLWEIADASREIFHGQSREEALELLYTTKSELKVSKDEMERFIGAVLETVVQTHRKQCARYDGPLGGTRVGMNLFYTDLLAKLWALDVNNEAPALRVPGFLSIARLPDSPFHEEDLKKPSTRVWFGPKKEAYTRSPEGTELRFRHVATRVFAAGSNSDQLQRQEGTPNEHSRRALGWWERHYADVADYEQEYHLQNQIMKWSVITGFFREKRLAPYLEQVPVSRTQQFGKWYEQRRSELKYQLPLVVDGGAGQECMDILTAKGGISGGVSLSGGKLAEVPVVKPTGPASLRHGVKAITGGEPAAQALGRALPEHAAPGVIRVEPLPSTTVRSKVVQLDLGPVELKHVRPGPGSYQLNLQASKTPVGSFHGVNTAGRTTLRWQPQQMDDAVRLAQRSQPTGEGVYVSVQTAKTSASRAKPKPFYPWHAEVHGLGGQVQISSAGGGETTWVRLSTAQPGTKMEAAQKGSLLANADWQRLHIAEGASGLETSQGVIRSASREWPTSGSNSVRVTGLKDFPEGLDVVVTKAGGIYVPRPRDANALKGWMDLDRSAAFTPRDLTRLREAAQSGRTTIARAELSRPEADRAARALVGHDKAEYQRQFKMLSKELGPEQSRQEIRRHLEDTADLRLARGSSGEASQLYDIASKHFGEASPGVQIRQQLADMASGRSGPDALERVLAHARKLPVTEREKVLRVTLGLKDMPDVTDFVRARLGFEGPIPGAASSSVRLTKVGPDVVTSYPLKQPIRGEPIKPDEFKQGLPKDAAIYAEDGLSFNKNDIQVNPAENMAELQRNPQVQLVRVQQMETGTYRPARLVEPESPVKGTVSERAYQRVVGPREGDAAEAAPVYMIRMVRPVPPAPPCDKNGDRQVSDEERQLCKAA